LSSIGVAVAHPDPGIADELVHAVEAEPDLYLALDPEKAAVLLAGARTLGSLAPHSGVAVVGVSADHDLAVVAREALRCRAHDVLSWPGERDSFRAIVRDAAARARLDAAGADGKIVAVAGARGGAGTTTIAAMLARAISDSAVVDLDGVGAGQAAFLADGAEPTFGDVLAAIEDLDPRAFVSAFTPHAAGRGLCVAPRSTPPDRAQAERLIALLRASVPLAVCDLGRAGGDASRVILEAADETLVVCAPDVTSMRGARVLGVGSVVLNQYARMRLSARDVARVLGESPVAVVPFDPSVRRAGEAGRLPRRGQARRAIEKLAAAITRGAADGS
jgi:pilus assembly protein CpaE